MNSISKDRNGRIITFYSFKGGSGRSMSLANMAVLFARAGAGREGNRVLMMDWDLEAPGLHEFFKQHIPINDLNEKPGVIDLFLDVDKEFPKGVKDEIQALDFIDSFFKRAIIRLNVSENLFLLKAGRFDEKYALEVQTFDWRGFFERSHIFLSLLIQYLKKQFDFTVIDSRTGLTDVGGICTSILPEVLVAVFTPTRQGLRVTEIIERAVRYRKGANDLRPLLVYPLASRIDTSAEDLNQKWKQDYTLQFEETFNRIYLLERCNLKPYFGKVEVHYVTSYSYGESVAVLDSADVINKHELPAKYDELVQLIIGEYLPWEMPDIPEPRLVSLIDHINFAQLLAKNKEFKRAERHFNRAIELAPQKGDGYLAFIEYLENRDELDMVEALYDEWLNRSREMPDENYWSKLALYTTHLIEKGSLDKAQNLLEQFFGMNDGVVPSQLQINYARILARKSLFNEAEMVYLKLINEQPENQPVKQGFANFLWQDKKDYPAAEKVFKELAKLEPEPGAYNTIIVQLLLLQGKKEEADVILSELLEQNDLTGYAKCLLWFLRLAYFPESFKKANQEILTLMENGISLPGRSFEDDLAIAEANNHPHLLALKELAAKLTAQWQVA